MDNVYRYTQPLAKILAKSFVPISLLSSQMEIAMCGIYGITKLVKDMGKEHTIGTSRQCYEILPFLTKKVFAIQFCNSFSHKSFARTKVNNSISQP